MHAKFTVSAQQLIAMGSLASTDETRYSLNVVHVEISQRDGILMVATDGRRMVVAAPEISDHEWDEEQSFSIPSTMVSRLHENDRKVTIERADDRITLRADIDEEIIVGVNRTGFPAWRCIFPNEFPISIGNATLLSVHAGFWADVCKLIDVFASSREGILVGKCSRGPYIAKGHNFIAALMPIVDNNTGDIPVAIPRPSWLKNKEAKKEAA